MFLPPRIVRLRLFLVCLLWWGSVSLVIAEPPWLVVRTRTFPNVVGLGQPIAYSAWVKVQPGYTVTIPPRSRLGRAQFLQSPKLRTSRSEANTYVVTLSLAVYQFQTYGPQTLPAMELAVRSPSGQLRYAKLPPVRFELVERYAGTKEFQLKSDPTLAPKLRQKQGPFRISHEWRPLPFALKVHSTRTSWDWTTLAGSGLLVLALMLLGLVLWQRQQRRKAEANRPLPPYEVALQQLQQLPWNQPPTVESYRQCLGEGLRIVRAYLQERLTLDVQHLTETELELTLRNSLAFRFSLDDAWFTRFHSLLKARQTLCYQPYPQADPSMNLSHDLRWLVDTLEAQAKAEDERNEEPNR